MMRTMPSKCEAVGSMASTYKEDKPEEAQCFLAQLGNPYRHIGIDRDGNRFRRLRRPETVVFDKEGHARYRQVGPITPEDYDGKTLLLLK